MFSSPKSSHPSSIRRTRSRKDVNLLSLPDDVLIRIMTYVVHPSHVYVAAVHPDLRSAVLKVPDSGLRKLDMLPMQPPGAHVPVGPPSQARSINLHVAVAGSCLTVLRLSCTITGEMVQSLLARVAKHCLFIVILEFPDRGAVNRAVLRDLFTSLHSLSSLSVIQPSYSTIVVLPHIQPSCTELNLEDFNPLNFLDLYDSLRTITRTRKNTLSFSFSIRPIRNQFSASRGDRGHISLSLSRNDYISRFILMVVQDGKRSLRCLRQLSCYNEDVHFSMSVGRFFEVREVKCDGRNIPDGTFPLVLNFLPDHTSFSFKTPGERFSFANRLERQRAGADASLITPSVSNLYIIVQLFLHNRVTRSWLGCLEALTIEPEGCKEVLRLSPPNFNRLMKIIREGMHRLNAVSLVNSGGCSTHDYMNFTDTLYRVGRDVLYALQGAVRTLDLPKTSVPFVEALALSALLEAPCMSLCVLRFSNDPVGACCRNSELGSHNIRYMFLYSNNGSPVDRNEFLRNLPTVLQIVGRSECTSLCALIVEGGNDIQQNNPRSKFRNTKRADDAIRAIDELEAKFPQIDLSTVRNWVQHGQT